VRRVVHVCPMQPPSTRTLRRPDSLERTIGEIEDRPRHTPSPGVMAPAPIKREVAVVWRTERRS
jgi:hypothetical protein